MHDPRIGRFFAIDPLADKYPHNSPYAFSENRVLDGVELEGLEVSLLNKEGNAQYGPLNQSFVRSESAKGGKLISAPDELTEDVGKDAALNSDMAKRGHAPSPEIHQTKKTAKVEGQLSNTEAASFNSSLLIATSGFTIGLGEGILAGQGVRTGLGVSTSTLAASSALALPLIIPGDVPAPRSLDMPGIYYRAMSSEEYSATGGLLVDINLAGEGPHISADPRYVSSGFIKKSSNYDVVVMYVSRITPRAMHSTPFSYHSALDKKGGPIFNAARASGLWYKKFEGFKGISYGFPGLSTFKFNNSLLAPPVPIKYF